MKIIVSIADAQFSNNPEDEIITYSLGSCIGVALHDPKTKASGMLHFQLPTHKTEEHTEPKNPLMYGDTGIEYMLKKLQNMGADKKRFKVKIAGGAQMMNDAQMFNIGKRNYSAIRQILWRHGMFVDAEDIGGKRARTMLLRVDTGEVLIKSQGEVKQL